MRLNATLPILALPLLGWAFAQPPAPPAPAPVDHAAAVEALKPRILAHWVGTAEVAEGQYARVMVDVIGPRAGTITLPEREITSYPLSEVDISDKRLRFSCVRLQSRLRIDFDLDVQPDGITAVGVMKQIGRRFPLVLKRSDAAGPVRPNPTTAALEAPVKSTPGPDAPPPPLTAPVAAPTPPSPPVSTVTPAPPPQPDMVRDQAPRIIHPTAPASVGDPRPVTALAPEIPAQPGLAPTPAPMRLPDPERHAPPAIVSNIRPAAPPLPPAPAPASIPAPAAKVEPVPPPAPAVTRTPGPTPTPPPAPANPDVKPVLSSDPVVPPAPAPAPALPPVPPPQPARAPAPVPAPTVIHWEGEARVTANIILSLTVEVSPPDRVRLSIPKHLINNEQATAVTLSDTSMKFTYAPPGMPPSFRSVFDLTIAPDGQSAAGTMLQMGDKVPVTLTRAAMLNAPVPAPSPAPAATAPLNPARPQTPRPPFPYEVREVTFTNPASGGTLAGTLTLPAPTRSPALLLITGSGAQDRDETIFNHKPFAVIADHLTRAGFVVLRVDDPGVGGSTNPRQGRGGGTTDDFVTDARAAIDYLKQQSGIDPARIGLLGHSEGGLIAPMLAAQDRGGIRFIILMAGTGVPGGELLTAQAGALTRAAGIADDQAAPMLAAHKALMRALADNLPEDQLLDRVRTLTRHQLEINAPGRVFTETELDAIAAQGLKQVNSPWLRRFVALNPRDALLGVTCPVLVLNGDKDAQVPSSQNVPAITRALAEAGNHAVTARILPGLNHLFQPAVTGSVAEYDQIQTTIDPSVLDEITVWLRRVTR